MKIRPYLLILLLAALVWTTVPATSILHSNLQDLCLNAGPIIRGTVVEATRKTVEIGGGTLAVMDYRIRVEENLREGQGPSPGDVLELRMLRPGGKVLGLPSLAMNQSYLLFVTQAAEGGLSTTVGLGQGCFPLLGRAGEETASNAFGNQGLFQGLADARRMPPGPIPYRDLAARIRNILATADSGP